MSKNSSNKNFDYASAPYNFIPFPDKVAYRHNINDLTHDKFYKNLKSGYIEYSIKTLTPLFVDNGKGEFFKINDEYVIPAGTVRGKVYSNAEILSSSYPRFIKDKMFWHRGCFEDTVLKDVYEKKVKPNKNDKINKYVRAGYLKRENGKWIIQPTVKVGEKNFEIIGEEKLVYLKKYLNTKCYMYDDEKYNKEAGKDFWSEISKLKKQKNEKKELLHEYLNDEFKPYFRNVIYYISDKKANVKFILGDNYEKFENVKYGMLMNSNNLSYKQVHYLIYEEDEDAYPIEIQQHIMNQYNINVKLRQNGEIKGFNLAEVKKRKRMPIFYIVDKKGQILSVGFTPYLKIPYKNSIKQLININKDNKLDYVQADGEIKKESNNEVEENKLDYVQALFGFSNENLNEKDKDGYSLKGRLSFTNAKLVKENKNIKFINRINKVLSDPKPTSFQLYLKQEPICKEKLDEDNKSKQEYIKQYKKQLKTYEEQAELRGSKFYWLKTMYDNKSVNKSTISSSIKAINKNMKFNGRIYFKNLTDYEIGMILMSIKPFQGAKDNLGKGKPYGFGKIEFNIEDIKEINIDNMFGSLNLQYMDYDSLEKRIINYIEEFKNEIKTELKDNEYWNSNRIQSFYLSKSKEVDLTEEEFKYMNLQTFKYREPLKNMDMYIKEINRGEEEVAISKVKSDNLF